MVKIIDELRDFFLKYEKIILFFLIGLMILLTIGINSFLVFDNRYPSLAWSLIHGTTYFITSVDSIDMAISHGHMYFPLGIFPAALFMPISWLSRSIALQSPVSFAVDIALFVLIYCLAKNRFNFSPIDSLWLATAYFFASVNIITLLFLSYYYAHAVASLLIFACLYEFFGKRRYWLIGLGIGLTMLTRYTAGLAGLFFILAIFFEKKTLNQKIKNMLNFIGPAIIAGLLLLAYNYARFDNFFDTGYQAANMNREFVSQYGLFNIIYIPVNIYHYFLETLVPLYATNYRGFMGEPSPILQFPYFGINQTGSLSFFIVAPIFFYLIKAPWHNKNVHAALLTSAIILLTLLTYFYNGWPQIGPRYANDFLPLLFLCLLYAFNKGGLSPSAKLLIFISTCFNAYLLHFVLL